MSVRKGSFLVVLLLSSLPLFADSKVTVRTTVMGHTTEGTTYIKGARERSETKMPMGMSMITITQCDQKRVITINPSSNTCMVTDIRGLEAAAEKMEAAAPSTPEPEEKESGPTRKGGTVTITTSSNDTGERQKMFGLTARHVKSSMSMQTTPDACHPESMSMERDGWYADFAPALSCKMSSATHTAAISRGGGSSKPDCRDNYQFKGSGLAGLKHAGYPLKETTTMNSGGQSFTMVTEVLDLTTSPLDAALFEVPQGCKVVTSYAEMMGRPSMAQMMGAMRGGPPPGVSPDVQPVAPAAKPAPAPPPVAPVAPTKAEPAAVVAPKTAGVVRVGVVKIKDDSGQYLPTDNLRINLMSEITRRSMEAVPLDATVPYEAVLAEAQQKQCDYILYTGAAQVKDPGAGGVALPAALRTVKLDPGKYQALLDVTLYRVGKPAPELKDLPLAADADQFGVNAVMAGFVAEADKVAEQVQEDAHPKKAPITTKKAPVKKK